MKKHILACAIVTGLVATAWPAASQPKVVEPTAQLAYMALKATSTEGAPASAVMAGSVVAGALIGSKVATVLFAAKKGAVLGSLVGPVGAVVGAAAFGA